MHLTKPLDISPADESTPEIEERLMDVDSPLVAYLQPPEAVDPRERPFDYPPTMLPQLLAGLDAASGDTRGYAPLSECDTATREVVSLVSMQLLWTLSRSATRALDGLYSVHGFFQDLGVVDVGSRVDHRERDASPVRNKVALRALFALVRWIRTGSLVPLERPHSPSPRMPSPNRSGQLLLSDPRASDAVVPTPLPRAIL
jgi:hypothetical protein